MIVTAFIFFAVVILTTLNYLAISLFARLLATVKKERVEFIASKKYKRWTFAISFIFAITICSYYLFSNPASTYKTACIEKSADKYILTIYQQRRLMAHDPISLLQRKTYLDSAKFELPKSDGVIDGTDIIYKDTYFKFLKGSSMTIKSETLTVNLDYISNYDSTKSKLALNGTYTLKWR